MQTKKINHRKLAFNSKQLIIWKVYELIHPVDCKLANDLLADKQCANIYDNCI